MEELRGTGNRTEPNSSFTAHFFFDNPWMALDGIDYPQHTNLDEFTLPICG